MSAADQARLSAIWRRNDLRQLVIDSRVVLIRAEMGENLIEPENSIRCCGESTTDVPAYALPCR